MLSETLSVVGWYSSGSFVGEDHVMNGGNLNMLLPICDVVFDFTPDFVLRWYNSILSASTFMAKEPIVESYFVIQTIETNSD